MYRAVACNGLMGAVLTCILGHVLTSKSEYKGTVRESHLTWLLLPYNTQVSIFYMIMFMTEESYKTGGGGGR